eukprot:COSAG02_NODE_593_length_19851_cov_13.232736_10_plen_57_part_00
MHSGPAHTADVVYLSDKTMNNLSSKQNHKRSFSSKDLCTVVAKRDTFAVEQIHAIS